MAAAPGQRAGQRPQRAALAAQRALGRAARGTNVMSSVMTARIGHQLWRITHDEQGRAWWECQQTGARCENGPCTPQEQGADD